MRLVIAFTLCLFICGSLASAAPQRAFSSDPECQKTRDIIGFVDIVFDEKTILNFYAKPEAAGQPAQTLRFYNDAARKMIGFRPEGKKSYSRLRPEAHKLDYFQFDLAVKNRIKDWVEVFVDDENKQTLWLPENAAVKFEDWLEKMKASFAVKRLAPEKNLLRAKPDDAAKEIILKGRDCFRVEEMQGEWIRVAAQTHCSDASKSSASGWIRWRDKDDCLLVEIFPFA